jgi:iduronate 2-sulfatase
MVSCFLVALLWPLIHLVTGKPLPKSTEGSSPKLNLLFIMFDDLRPQLSIYGNQQMITPNFERLAQRSVVFDYAFCQVAVCNPSRVSLLTGLRPDTTKTWGFQNAYKPHMIFPSLLVSQGYHTKGYGKLIHWEHNQSWCWSDGNWRGQWAKETYDDLNHMKSSYKPETSKLDADYLDYQLVTRTIDSLRSYQQERVPFMISLGFRLPHLPVRVPKRYFDLYAQTYSNPLRSIKYPSLRYPNTSFLDHECCSYPAFSYINKSLSAHKFTRHINEAIPEEMYREMNWGYSAAITYLDDQLGRLLDALDELDLWKSIIVVLTSDHGMHNGEKGLW